MNYEEVKLKHDKLRREVFQKKNAIKDLQDEVDSLSNEKVLVENNYRSSYSKAQSAALEEYKRKTRAPFEEGLSVLECELTSLKNEYTEKLSSLTLESLMGQCSSEQDILTEVEAAASMLEERVRHAVGDGFYKELIHQMDVQRVNLEQHDLQKIIDYFNSSKETLEKMESNPDAITKVMDKIEEFLLNAGKNQVSEANKTTTAIITLAALLMIFVAYKFIFPIYAIFIIIFVGFNIVRSHNIYKSLVIQKAVQDNISEIHASLQRKVLEEHDKRKDEITFAYEDAIDKKKEQINKEQDKLNRVSLVSDDTFEFDDSPLRTNHDTIIKQKEFKKIQLMDSMHTLENDNKELWEQIDFYKMQMKEMLKNMQADMLDFSRIGTDTIFNTRFILDIKDEKPIYFDHKQVSSLFLYQNLTETNDFIRLLMVQLRSKLSPFSYNTTLFDPTYIGAKFLCFQASTLDNPKKDPSLERMFKIITEPNELTPFLESTKSDVLKRTQNIKRSYDSIEDYNKEMLKIESLTETYEFIFFIDPSAAILQSQDLLMLLRVAGELGVFIHLFISFDWFKSSKDLAKSIVENISKIYFLQNDSLVERAKDYIANIILNSE